MSRESAGIEEQRPFAEVAGSRIPTGCIGSPPGRHPGEWVRAWRFGLPEEAG